MQVGVALERDDKEAFGDKMGGMFVYVPLTVLALWRHLRSLPVTAAGG